MSKKLEICEMLLWNNSWMCRCRTGCNTTVTVRLVNAQMERYEAKRKDRLRRSVQDTSSCRGNSFDEEQKQPLSSKATYWELSGELDMLNTHYLSHLSPQSWWDDKGGPEPSQKEEKCPAGRWRSSFIGASAWRNACRSLQPSNYDNLSGAQMKRCRVH